MKIVFTREISKIEYPNTPALVFIHGAWHGAWCWQPNFLPFFASNGFDCYAFDLPKHGAQKSEKGINKLRIKDYVQCLKEAIAQIEKPVILIGHSLGGYTVQKYLEEHDNCKAAILLASVPGKPILRLFFQAWKDLPHSMLKLITQFNLSHLVNTPEKASKFLFSPMLPKEQLNKYWKSLGPESFRIMVFDFLLSRIKARKNKEIPVLVQAAELDAMVSLRENKYTAVLQNADFQLIKNLAHDVMLEKNWRQSAESTLNWIYDKFPQSKLDPFKKEKIKPTQIFSDAIPDIIANLPAQQKVGKNDKFN